MKITYSGLAVCFLIFANNSAIAQEQSPWLVRARIVDVEPANKSDPIGGVGASDRINVSNKTIPELDISYFFSDHIATELILTYPQKHDVSLDGNNIGSFKELPPTLLIQYHFSSLGAFTPYIGAGINYTNISAVNLMNGAGSLDHGSVGAALQAGLNYKIDKNWSVNFDIKKIQIRSDVDVGGVKVSNVQVDPLLVSLGIGYRF